MAVSKELRDWVRDGLRKGVSEDKLRKELVKAGYSDKDIGSAFKEVKMGPKVNVNPWIMGVLAIVVIIGIFYLYNALQTKVMVIKAEDMEHSTGSALEGGGWGLYSNGYISKEIELPKSWVGKEINLEVLAWADGLPPIANYSALYVSGSEDFSFEELFKNETYIAPEPVNITTGSEYMINVLGSPLTFTYSGSRLENFKRARQDIMKTIDTEGEFRMFTDNMTTIIYRNYSISKNKLTFNVSKVTLKEGIWPHVKVFINDQYITELMINSESIKKYVVKIHPPLSPTLKLVYDDEVSDIALGKVNGRFIFDKNVYIKEIVLKKA